MLRRKQWGEYIIEVGASIDLKNRIQVAQVSYEYSVVKKGELKVDYDYNGVLVYITLVY